MFPFSVRHRGIVPFGDPQFALLRLNDLLDEYSTSDVRVDGWRVTFTSVRRGWSKLEKRVMPIPSGFVLVEEAGPGVKRVTLEYDTSVVALLMVMGVAAGFAMRGGTAAWAIAGILAFNWIVTYVQGVFFWRRILSCF